MMLFEGDLSFYSDGMLDLGLVNSVSAWRGHGLDMGRRGARDFWNILHKDTHIQATPFMAILQNRGREDW